MFQDRINHLQQLLKFPLADFMDEDAFCLFTSHSQLYWNPQLLSLSYFPPARHTTRSPFSQHLYYFRHSMFGVSGRRTYEYEELYE